MRIKLNLTLSVLLLCTSSGPLWAAENPITSPPEAKNTQANVLALIAQADALIVQNLYEDAIEILGEAYQYAGQPEDSALARNVLNSLATLYYNTGQLEAATRYFEELVVIDEKSSDLQGLSVSLFNLGHAAASRQLFSEADAYFKRSLLLSQQLDDVSGAGYTLKAMGVNAQATGELLIAETLLLSALDKFTVLGNEQQQAAVLRHLGDINLEQDAPEAALEYYLQALPVLARNAFNSALLRTYRGLSLAYESLGKLDKALIAQRAYSDLMQFELEQQGQETTQRMQAQFETQRYADNNTRLHAIRIQQDLQLEESKQMVRLQFLVLILGLGMMGLVLYMLFRSRLTAKRMHRLAITDELTSLINRRAIMEKGKEEWLRAARFNHPFSCLMFDIDHFKSINDTLGHAIGDEALRTISVILQGLLRKTDFVGRVGGEEFLLLAPETDRTQAFTLAERIRIGIQNANIPGITDRQVTVSIGVAGLHKESSLEQLIQHADKALYTAKESGRNRSIVFQEKLEVKSEKKSKPTLELDHLLQFSA